MGPNSYVCRSHREKTGRGGEAFCPLPSWIELKEAWEKKLQKVLNRELQTTEKLTVDLKEFQNKTIHVETLESVVRVKDKVLKNLKLSHDKFNEKLEERTCNLRPNTKSTDKLNEKLDRKTE